jgi:hypothetical protein
MENAQKFKVTKVTEIKTSSAIFRLVCSNDKRTENKNREEITASSYEELQKAVQNLIFQ